MAPALIVSYTLVHNPFKKGPSKYGQQARKFAEASRLMYFDMMEIAE